MLLEWKWRTQEKKQKEARQRRFYFSPVARSNGSACLEVFVSVKDSAGRESFVVFLVLNCIGCRATCF